MYRPNAAISLLIATFVLAAVPAHSQGETGAARWSAEKVTEVPGFLVPESVLPDPERNQVFVSNIEAPKDHYWDDDKTGFISLLSREGAVQERRWLDTHPDAVVHGPKGMCLLGGKLYFTDNATLKRCDVDAPGDVETIALPQTERLNDLATDGTSVYVSDTALGIIYRIAPDGAHNTIPAPPSPNGVTCHDGKLYGVSWGAHEVYELDPAGKAEPKPFGVAEHFTNLDGIEVFEDGTFIVSDFYGNKVSAITPDRKTVYTLVKLETPADIGLDRKRGLLYVPQFMADKVAIFRLEQ